MKILLIFPPFQLGRWMGKIMRSPPLSLLQLASMVPDHQVEVLDLNTTPQMGVTELERKIAKFDLVGVTCMTITLKAALNICKIAKRNEITTVMGGFHPTLNPDVMNYQWIDYLVRGEGEYTFKELIAGIPPSKILGLSYRDNGNYHHNNPRPFIKNLDTLPYTPKDLIDYTPYHYFWNPADAIETSRGCLFNCSFCCVTQFYCRTYRTKSPERVLKEIARVPTNQKMVSIVDDNFSLDYKRVMRICDLIQEYGYHKRLMFACQSRVADIAKHPDMVQKMAKSGFVSFFMGFESFKQMTLNSINKQLGLPDVKKAIKNIHDNGMMVFGSFIIGNIGETREDILKTLKLIKELQIDTLITYPLTPFPGTKLNEIAVNNGWLDKDFDWTTWHFDTVMRTPDLSTEDIHELLDYSYQFFYKDLGYFPFGKKILRILHPKYRWFWKTTLNKMPWILHPKYTAYWSYNMA